jgi:hypothetical protein
MRSKPSVRIGMRSELQEKRSILQSKRILNAQVTGNLMKSIQLQKHVPNTDFRISGLCENMVNHLLQECELARDGHWPLEHETNAFEDRLSCEEFELTSLEEIFV